MNSFITGRNPVAEWLRTDMPVLRLIIAEGLRGKTISDIIDSASAKSIPIIRMRRHRISELIGHEKHQGVAAEIRMREYDRLEDIFRVAQQSNEPPLIAILDGIQDPQNLGAIIRSAEGAAFHGIIIPQHRAAGLTPSVFKASAGAAAYFPIVRVVNISRLIDDLKREGIWIVGTSREGGRPYWELDFKDGTGIVLGSEGEGMHRIVREKCDFLASIPMMGRIESLNVSVAAGLIFFEARRQRNF